MKLTDLFSITSETYPYFPQIVKRLGISVNAGLFLSYIGWKTTPGSDGWVEKSLENVEFDLGLTVWEQRGARKQLVAKGVLQERHNTLEHRSFYKVCGELPQSWDSTNADIGENQRRDLPKPMPGLVFTNSLYDKESSKKVQRESNGAAAPSALALEASESGKPQNSEASEPSRSQADASRGPKCGPSRARGTLEECRAFAIELGLPASDGEAFFWGKEGTGWAKVKDWRATIRNWKAQGWLASQRGNGGSQKHFSRTAVAGGNF